jgi:cell division protein FtsQ
VAAGLAGLAPGWFDLARVEVAGVETISPDELRRRIDLVRGVPRDALHPVGIEMRLKAHPRIAEASVSRVVPGVLLVRVVERRPVARVRAPKGEWWVDATGMPFEPDALAPGAGKLPLLVAGSAVALGTRSAVLASALGQVDQLRGMGLAVAEWHLGDRAAIGPLARLRGAGPPLLLGNGDRDLQVQRLARALALWQVREAGAIDLRFRDQVIFWPAAPDRDAAGKWAQLER